MIDSFSFGFGAACGLLVGWAIVFLVGFAQDCLDAETVAADPVRPVCESKLARFKLRVRKISQRGAVE